MNLLPRVTRRLVSIGLNNMLVNGALVMLGRDSLIKRVEGDWAERDYDVSKSAQENVGYSHHPEIERSLELVREALRNMARRYVRGGGSILEIGCGTGLFLEQLKEYRLTGVDLNQRFLDKAKELVPCATLIAGDYMTARFEAPFDMIYLIGVLPYIEPSRIAAFFAKVAADVRPQGVLLIQYPHALRWQDLFYPDLRYVRYSPRRLAQLAAPHFEVESHRHLVDDRQVNWYDRKHYYFPDGTRRRTDTNLNTSVLIARRR